MDYKLGPIKTLMECLGSSWGPIERGGFLRNHLKPFRSTWKTPLCDGQTPFLNGIMECIATSLSRLALHLFVRIGFVRHGTPEASSSLNTTVRSMISSNQTGLENTGVSFAGKHIEVNGKCSSNASWYQSTAAGWQPWQHYAHYLVCCQRWPNYGWFLMNYLFIHGDFQFAVWNLKTLSASGCVGKISWAPFSASNVTTEFCTPSIAVTTADLLPRPISLFWDGMQCSEVLLYTEFRWHFYIISSQ